VYGQNKPMKVVTGSKKVSFPTWTLSFKRI